MQRTLLEGVPTLEQVALILGELEQRMTALERRAELAPPQLTEKQDLPAPAPALTVIPLPAVAGSLLLVLGRALLGFAGAYLLRAAADSGAVPQRLALTLAFVYGLGWLIWSTRVGLNDRFGCYVYGLTAALIVSAMLWETTVQSHVLPSPASAAIAALFTAAGLLLASERTRCATTRIATLTGTTMAFVLLLATRDLVPFTAALLVIAALVEYAACHGRLLDQRWVPALAADLSVLVILFVVSRPQGLPEGYHTLGIPAVILVQIALVLIYGVSTAYRTLIQGLDITGFEAVQNLAALALLLKGSLNLNYRASGVFCAAAGAACYAASMARLKDRCSRRNFHVYLSFGLLLLMAGAVMLLSGFGLVAVFGALGIGATILGRQTRCLSLQMHSGLYLAAAAGFAGLLGFGYRAMLESSPPFAGTAPLLIVTATLSAAVCYAMSIERQTAEARLPALVLAAVLCWSLLGFAASGVTAALQSRGLAEASTTATLRTGLICGMAILLALACSRWDRRECLWLVYPLMVFAAFKLLFQDFPQGRAAAVAISLLFCGGTLLVLPRCARAIR